MLFDQHSFVKHRIVQVQHSPYLPDLVLTTFSCFLNGKFSSRLRDLKTLKESLWYGFIQGQKFQGCFDQWKTHWNKCIWMSRGLFWRKLMFHFIVHFCIGKYSFRLNSCWRHLVTRRKLVFQSLFISVLVNTALVSILFEHTSYFEDKVWFFVHFYLGK